jgi:hypothetical protein
MDTSRKAGFTSITTLRLAPRHHEQLVRRHEIGFQPPVRRRRHVGGRQAYDLLKARLNASSESYPTSWAITATFTAPPESSRAAGCMRQCAR